MITYIANCFRALKLEALYITMLIEDFVIYFSDTPTGMLHIQTESIILLLNFGSHLPEYNNNNNNKLQLGCHPVAVIILHVNKT